MRNRVNFFKIPKLGDKKSHKPKSNMFGFLKKSKNLKVSFKNDKKAKMPSTGKMRFPKLDLEDLRTLSPRHLLTGIRGKIIFLSVFTMICMLIPIVLSISSLKSNITKDLGELNKVTNASIAEKVENQIKQNMLSLDLFTKSSDIFAMDPYQQERALRKLIENRFESIIFTDAEGNVLFATDFELKDTNIKDTPWFSEAIKGTNYISDSILDERTKQSIIYISVPVIDQYLKPAAVIAVKMDLDYLHTIIKENKVGENGIAYIIDRKGVVLAHPDIKEKVLKTYNAVEHNIFGAKKIIEGISGTDIYDNDKGEKVYGTYSIIPSTGWGMLTELPVSEAMEPVQKATKQITVMSIIALMLAIIGALILAILITRPLKNMAKVAAEVKNGDLSKRIKITDKDEIGQLQVAFNQMTDSLASVLSEVGIAISEVTDMSQKLSEGAQISSAATEEITAIVESVAEGAQSQISSVNTSANITREISNSVVNTSNKTQTVAQSATGAAQIAQEGSDNIKIINEKIIGIKDNVINSASLVEKLGNKSKEVTSMVKVIKDIAGKTNMLALNAAIEAARAGDAGKGFAVVANEIRNLAEQTKEASKDIETLLTEMQDETDYTVKAMNEGLIEVEAGTAAISATYSTFNKIIEEVQTVARDINNVSEAVLNLKSESERIITSIEEVNEIAETTSLGTQSVLASTEEQASSIQEISNLAVGLSNTAVMLKDIILKFKI